MKRLFWTALTLLITAPLFASSLNPQANTVERNVGEFDAIHISGWFDVTLVKGQEGMISLAGKESVLKNIKTEVKNGKLHIEWDKDVKSNIFKGMSNVSITIPVEQINAVVLAGSGSVVSETTLQSDSFETTLSGSGSLDLRVETNTLSSTISGSGKTELTGSTQNYEVQISGSGDVKAFELKAEDVKASISGSAKVRVNANSSVTARISGSGDVRYIGNATKIDSKVSGSGSVSKG